LAIPKSVPSIAHSNAGPGKPLWTIAAVRLRRRADVKIRFLNCSLFLTAKNFSTDKQPFNGLWKLTGWLEKKRPPFQKMRFS
jgi:hypothetical protein